MITVNNNATSTTGIITPSSLKLERKSHHNFDSFVQYKADNDNFSANAYDDLLKMINQDNDLLKPAYQAVNTIIDNLADMGEAVDELLDHYLETRNVIKSDYPMSSSTSTAIHELTNALSDKFDGLNESMDKLSILLADALKSGNPLSKDSASQILQVFDLHSENLDRLGQLLNMIKSGNPMSMYAGTSSDFLHELDYISDDLDKFSSQLEGLAQPGYWSDMVELPFPNDSEIINRQG